MKKQLLIALGALLSASCFKLQAIPTSELMALLADDIEKDNKRNEKVFSELRERNDEVLKAQSESDREKVLSHLYRMGSAGNLVLDDKPLVKNPQALATLKQIAQEDADWLTTNKDKVVNNTREWNDAIAILTNAKIMLIRLNQKQ